MMYEKQQQVGINNMRIKKQREDLYDDSNELEIVDLSGMSLDYLPNPPLNLATICKLDLSNNNLQVYKIGGLPDFRKKGLEMLSNGLGIALGEDEEG